MFYSYLINAYFLPEDDPEGSKQFGVLMFYLYNFVLDFVHFAGYYTICSRQEYFFTR